MISGLKQLPQRSQAGLNDPITSLIPGWVGINDHHPRPFYRKASHKTSLLPIDIHRGAHAFQKQLAGVGTLTTI